MDIAIDDPARPDVVGLLAEHLADMHATSPPESVHALDVTGLTVPGITFWTARREGSLLGCGALKRLDPVHGEVKSMRTATAARGSGVAAAILTHLLDHARQRGYLRISLETGTQEFFEPARRLYARHGFGPCGPFGDYVDDPGFRPAVAASQAQQRARSTTSRRHPARPSQPDGSVSAFFTRTL